MNVTEILEQVKAGSLDIKEAEKVLKKLPYEDMEFAKLDHHRKIRQGFGEVIYCSGKVTGHLVQIFTRLAEENKRVLGTRATEEQYLAVKKMVPGVIYDEISNTLVYEKEKAERKGMITVCSAGTADIPVAEEAAITAEFFGNNVTRVYDVGVAGIHRLFANLEVINSANCIIAAAGMEGALPSVIAGLVEKPVIAVPTSVGYGTNFHGVSALLTMINSCANGISVVNIDNGYGAGYVATQINRLAGEKNE